MFQSVLEQEVATTEARLRESLAGLDPDDIPAGEATRLFDGLDRIVRTATAARTLLARRVDDSLEWKHRGYRSAAEFMAARSGTSLGLP